MECRTDRYPVVIYTKAGTLMGEDQRNFERNTGLLHHTGLSE